MAAQWTKIKNKKKQQPVARNIICKANHINETVLHNV